MKLWLGQSISCLGDGMVPVAVALTVFYLKGSASALGLVLTASVIPRIVLTPIGGVWADRLPRKWVMVGADAVRLFAHLTLGILLLTNQATIMLLTVLAVVFGSAVAFFRPAYTGLIPSSTGGSDLAAANALTGMTVSLGNLIGPAVAGILATQGLGWLFIVDAATFAVSIGFLVGVTEHKSATPKRLSFIEELGAGWRITRSNTWIWTGILTFAVFNFAFSAVFVLAPSIATHRLGGSGAWASICVAAGVGSVLAGWLGTRLDSGRPLVFAYRSLLLATLEPLSLALSLPLWAVCLATCLSFAGTALSGAFWFSSLQRGVDSPNLSKVSSLNWLGALALMPLGYAIVGPLAAGIGQSTVLLIVAAAVAVICVWTCGVGEVRTFAVDSSGEAFTNGDADPEFAG